MKRLSLVLAATLAVPAAHALPLISVYGGGYGLQTKSSGTIASGSDNIDVEDDLGFGDRNTQNVLFLGVEHAVPLVPNARLRYTDISDSGTARLDRPIIFKGEAFAPGTEMRSSYDLQMLDGTAYYSYLGNPVQLDLGLTVRQLDADIRLRSVTGNAREKASSVFPLLHGKFGFNVPFTGFYGNAEINAISYDGSRMSDFTARVGWRSEFMLGVELGYSDIRIKLDDVSGLDTDLTINGPFLGVSLQF